ncbi:helix-turn-helix transcriptional regulator [Pseudokineococcus sp. 1T1Z-3]|uniref:helix-turn-helix transcriptional regulator n=1 Tax=Pseudokineococcus sp. 1T1Z-3 TaxID=3132745 RepID=UPI0030B16AA5
MSPAARASGRIAGPAATAPGAGAADRLSRLLAMVPWLLERQGVALEEAARHFDVSTDQLVTDLELLFVCGTPGHMPGDLIEAEWESGRVYLGNADAIARPLRLGQDEALALLVGLRTLADLQGVEDSAALEGALAKLSAAAGDAVAAASSVQLDLATGADTGVLATVRGALRRTRRLRLRYLTAARDETTDRDVDPVRLDSRDGHFYLQAWCHRAQDVRSFRLDRVVTARELDEDGTPPADVLAPELDDRLFVPGQDLPLVVLDLAPSARWVVDSYPLEDVAPSPRARAGQEGPWLRVRLRVADDAWLRRLVLRLGGAAVVVSPPGLAGELASAARAALAHAARVEQ